MVRLREQATGKLAMYPLDDEAKRVLEKFSDGEVIIIDLKKSRNPQYHRYAWAMFRTLHDMVEEPMPLEPWVKLMTTKIGRFTSVGKVDIKGTTMVAVIPDSIAYESMDEVEFQSFTGDFHNYFIERYGNKITYDKLMEAIGFL